MHKKYYKTDNRKEFYRLKFVEQNGCCAICGKAERLVIDHDHSSGIMRGLLCHTHNTALGLFGDDAELLRKAANYLQNHVTTAFVQRRVITDKHKNYVKSKELIPKLLADPKFVSDRARARELANMIGCKESTAQTRIARARRKK